MRSSDNCYTLTSPSYTCHKINFDDTKLWHDNLWHLNYKSLKKLSDAGAVRGLLKLDKQLSEVFGPCQHGKQLKTTHKVVQHTSTSKVLELLHMDLMGPMQVESIAGKRYIFVCVDDFSRFTWVSFIREKSYTFDSFKELCLKLKNEKNSNIGRIVRIRSDHRKEFETSIFSNFFLISMVYLMSFPHLRHHNKMVLLRGKIIHCRRWPV